MCLLPSAFTDLAVTRGPEHLMVADAKLGMLLDFKLDLRVFVRDICMCLLL